MVLVGESWGKIFSSPASSLAALANLSAGSPHFSLVPIPGGLLVPNGGPRVCVAGREFATLSPSFGRHSQLMVTPATEPN